MVDAQQQQGADVEGSSVGAAGGFSKSSDMIGSTFDALCLSEQAHDGSDELAEEDIANLPVVDRRSKDDTVKEGAVDEKSDVIKPNTYSLSYVDVLINSATPKPSTKDPSKVSTDIEGTITNVPETIEAHKDDPVARIFMDPERKALIAPFYSSKMGGSGRWADGKIEIDGSSGMELRNGSNARITMWDQDFSTEMKMGDIYRFQNTKDAISYVVYSSLKDGPFKERLDNFRKERAALRSGPLPEHVSDPMLFAIATEEQVGEYASRGQQYAEQIKRARKAAVDANIIDAKGGMFDEVGTDAYNKNLTSHQRRRTPDTSDRLTAKGCVRVTADTDRQRRINLEKAESNGTFSEETEFRYGRQYIQYADPVLYHEPAGANKQQLRNDAEAKYKRLHPPLPGVVSFDDKKSVIMKYTRVEIKLKEAQGKKLTIEETVRNFEKDDKERDKVYPFAEFTLRRTFTQKTVKVDPRTGKRALFLDDAAMYVFGTIYQSYLAKLCFGDPVACQQAFAQFPVRPKIIYGINISKTMALRNAPSPASDDVPESDSGVKVSKAIGYVINLEWDLEGMLAERAIEVPADRIEGIMHSLIQSTPPQPGEAAEHVRPAQHVAGSNIADGTRLELSVYAQQRYLEKNTGQAGFPYMFAPGYVTNLTRQKGSTLNWFFNQVRTKKHPVKYYALAVHESPVTNAKYLALVNTPEKQKEIMQMHLDIKTSGEDPQRASSDMKYMVVSMIAPRIEVFAVVQHPSDVAAASPK